MKPVKLTMQSFGSYGKNTVIDFTKPNQNLFLITGDTGSGKTTIFDAMVFALYGDVSSSDNVREGTEIQSHYSDTNVIPFVELVFSEHIDGEDRVFTVKRTPQHFETKKRGAGTTKKGEEVSLFLPDGMEYTANLKDTNTKIAETVGFTKEQFMQVGMIAQGEFMKVLRENTASKKQIFSKLFNTQIFQKITEELKERCKTTKGDIESIKVQYGHITRQIEIPENYSDAELMSEIKNRVLSSESINPHDMNLLTEKLSLMCSDINERKTAAEKVLLKEEKNREQLIEKLSAASALSESYKHLREADENLKKYAAEKENIKKKKILAAEIEKSYEIKTKFDAYDEAEKTLSKLKENLKNSENALPENTENKRAAEEEEKAENIKFRKINEEFTVTSERVSKAKEKFSKAALLQKDISQKENAVKKAGKELAVLEETKNSVQKRISEIREQLDKLSGADKALGVLQVKLKNYISFENEIKEVGELQRGTDAERVRTKKLQNDYKKADSEYYVLYAKYNSKRKIYFDSQAGLLAQNLQDNMPCPVCGSLSHPSPCALPESAVNITPEELNELEQKANDMRDNAAKISKEISALTGKINESENNINQKISSLKNSLSEYITGLDEEMTFDVLSDAYRSYRSVLENQYREAAGNLRNYENLSKELNADTEKLEELRTDAEAKSQELKSLEIDYKEKSAELNQVKSDIDFKNEAEADNALKSAEEIRNAEEKKYRLTDAKLKAAQKKLTENEAEISKYKKEIPECSETVKNKKNDYMNSLSAADITEEKWKEIVSAYKNTYKNDLAKEVSDYAAAVTAALKAKENAEKIIKGQPEPETDKTAEQKNESEIRCAELSKEFERFKDYYKTDSKALNDLEPLKNRSMDTVAKYTVIKSLYDRLSGNVTNSRMDLETFVQRYYLQRILDSANKRFCNMSAGQYELRMFDEESAGKGSNKGLDLKVYSTVTGKEREVGTLSGGESFMAALSLALGMSDQIQENTSAVNLDVMFIDEGFGSLDDHSRNQAIRVLQQMAGGSKLIGIISHVTELKQEIDNQLAVTKDNEGSHAEWKIS